MQIAQARTQANRIVESKVLESLARRPDPDAKVMVRLPSGYLVKASDRDTLVESTAKRLQYEARRKGQ